MIPLQESPSTILNFKTLREWDGTNVISPGWFGQTCSKTVTINPTAQPFCAVKVNPSLLTGSGFVDVTVITQNMVGATDAEINCFENDPNTTFDGLTRTCSYTATTSNQSMNVNAKVGSQICTTATVSIDPIPIIPIPGAPIISGACPLENGNDSITRTDNLVTVDLTGLISPPAPLSPILFFTSQNESIPCTVSGMGGSCVIPAANSNERSFKVSVNCIYNSQPARTDYFVTLYPKAVSGQSSSVPDVPFVFVFVIIFVVAIVLTRSKK